MSCTGGSPILPNSERALHGVQQCATAIGKIRHPLVCLPATCPSCSRQDPVNTMVSSLIAALGDLRAPRVLAVLFVPPLAALLVWGMLAWAFSDDWARWVADWIATSRWLTWVGKLGLSSGFSWGSGIMAVIVLLPIMLITAVLAAGIVAMPIIVPWIGERRFPGLQRREGGTIVGTAVNAMIAVVIFAVL